MFARKEAESLSLVWLFQIIFIDYSIHCSFCWRSTTFSRPIESPADGTYELDVSGSLLSLPLREFEGDIARSLVIPLSSPIHV